MTVASDDEPVELDDASDEGGVPADLVELHEVLEWQRAVAAGDGEPA